MKNKHHLEVLNKSYFFANMSIKEIELLLPSLNPLIRKFKKGETIIHKGEKVRHFGIMLEGKAHIVQEDYWGRQMIISELQSSDAFAEAFATLSAKSEVSVMATADSIILMLNIDDLLNIKNNSFNTYHNTLIKNLLKSTAYKNLTITQKMIHMSKKTIREKLLSYLSGESIKNDSTKFLIPFNRQELANYLGVDRSALSTEISKLTKEGIIKSKKNQFEIGLK